MGQLTSMWSRSYQNLHCSQKFHPDQGQRRWMFQQGQALCSPKAAFWVNPRACGHLEASKGHREPPNLAPRASGSGSGSCQKPGLRAGAVCN